MMQENMEVLSENEENTIIGGMNTGCAGGAILIGAGIVTCQLEAVAWGIAFASLSC